MLLDKLAFKFLLVVPLITTAELVCHSTPELPGALLPTLATPFLPHAPTTITASPANAFAELVTLGVPLNYNAFMSPPVAPPTTTAETA